MYVNNKYIYYYIMYGSYNNEHIFKFNYVKYKKKKKIAQF